MANGIPAYRNVSADRAANQANRTDPLAPYTRSGTSQPRRRITGTTVPPNPYQGTGTRAAWNYQQQRWIPETPAPVQQPSTPWWEKIATPVVTVLASPFSREAQQDIGESIGNVLSASPQGAQWEWLANKTPERVVDIANQVLSGQEYLGQVGGNIQQGEYAEAVKNLGLGFGSTALDAVTARMPWKRALGLYTGVNVGQQLTGTGAPSVSDQFRQMTADRAERAAQPQAATVTTPRPRTATGMAEQSTAGFTSMGQGQPYYQQSPYGSQPVLEYTDDAGRVNTWNPRMKMYEVTALAGDEEALAAKAAEANIPQLSAAEQLFYDNQLRAIEDETQAILAELGVAEQTARSRAEEETGATRRQVAGGGQNVASALAFMGLDTSPGVLGVAQEDIAGAGARQEQQIQRALADQIAQFSSQRAAQERQARAERVRIESERALAQQRLIEEEARRQQELALFRGGY